jgi:two-component system copper resistance phosphate regulon response regulator CusR
MARILVVEDEPRIANFVSRALVAAGYQVDTAGDGDLALARFSKHTYRLVVLDLLLPGVDGFTVLQTMIDMRPEQSVLVLSAMPDVASKVKCLEIGASDYLTKPFALSELLARVRARMRTPAAEIPDRYVRVGDVTLDMVRRVADAGRGPATVSEREFALLEYLMRKGGEVCSRSELLEEVWGISFDTGSNVVDVTIAHLRAKLGNDVIETVRNVGYRLNAA